MAGLFVVNVFKDGSDASTATVQIIITKALMSTRTASRGRTYTRSRQERNHQKVESVKLFGPFFRFLREAGEEADDGVEFGAGFVGGLVVGVEEDGEGELFVGGGFEVAGEGVDVTDGAGFGAELSAAEVFEAGAQSAFAGGGQGLAIDGAMRMSGHVFME